MRINSNIIVALLMLPTIFVACAKGMNAPGPGTSLANSPGASSASNGPSLIPASSGSAQATNGGSDGGGGDPSEIHFKEIAKNIEDWIKSGNADGLQLPSDISLQTYKTKMLNILDHYHISFTDKDVMFGGVLKTCRGSVDEQQQFQIVCNIARFEDAYENRIDDVYKIIHHEFAGLVRVEKNEGQDSDYFISSQISRSLRQEIVWRLPVTPSSQNLRFDPFGPDLTDQKVADLEKRFANGSPALSPQQDLGGEVRDCQTFLPGSGNYHSPEARVIISWNTNRTLSRIQIQEFNEASDSIDSVSKTVGRHTEISVYGGSCELADIPTTCKILRDPIEIAEDVDGDLIVRMTMSGQRGTHTEDLAMAYYCANRMVR